MRLREGAGRAARLRRLRAAGSRVGQVHRAGPRAGSLKGALCGWAHWETNQESKGRRLTTP
eukprot:7000269-Pyramimonas_sp.AAC.1